MKQDRRKRLTREKIFQSTRDLLARDIEVDEIKMQDIVERSELSRTTLYQYFGSVGEIISAMGAAGIERWLAAFTPPDQWRSEHYDGLVYAYGHLARIVRRDRRIWAAMSRSGGIDRPPMRAAVSTMNKALVEVLQSARAHAEIVPAAAPVELAYILNTTQVALCLRWSTGNFPRGSLRKWLELSLSVHVGLSGTGKSRSR